LTFVDVFTVGKAIITKVNIQVKNANNINMYIYFTTT